MRKIYKYLSEHVEVIVGLGFVIWALSYIDGLNPESESLVFVIPLLIFLFTLYKSFYYVVFLKERIGLHYVKNQDFAKAVFAIVLTLISISLSFAVDYLLIANFVSDSFSGYSGDSFLSRIFDFIYFSIMTLTTLGYAGVEPSGYWAKSIVAVQVITSFSIVVFLISNMNKIKAFSEGKENI